MKVPLCSTGIRPLQVCCKKKSVFLVKKERKKSNEETNKHMKKEIKRDRKEKRKKDKDKKTKR